MFDIYFAIDYLRQYNKRRTNSDEYYEDEAMIAVESIINQPTSKFSGFLDENEVAVLRERFGFNDLKRPMTLEEIEKLHNLSAGDGAKIEAAALEKVNNRIKQCHDSLKLSYFDMSNEAKYLVFTDAKFKMFASYFDIPEDTDNRLLAEIKSASNTYLSRHVTPYLDLNSSVVNLGLGDQYLESLSKCCVYTIGDIAYKPESQLPRCFGYGWWDKEVFKHVDSLIYSPKGDYMKKRNQLEDDYISQNIARYKEALQKQISLSAIESQLTDELNTIAESLRTSHRGRKALALYAATRKNDD